MASLTRGDLGDIVFNLLLIFPSQIVDAIHLRRVFGPSAVPKTLRS